MNRYLRNASINVKVALAPALAMAGLVIVALMAWGATRALSADLSRIGGEGVQHVVDAQLVTVRLTQLQQKLYQSLTWEAVGVRAEAIKAHDTALLAELDALSKSMAAKAVAPGHQTIDKDLAAAIESYRKTAIDTLDIKTAGVATAASFVMTIDAMYEKGQKLAAQYLQQQRDAAHAVVVAAEASVRQRALQLAGMSLLLLIVCSVLSWALARAITLPLSRAAAAASQLAQGDLTMRQADHGADATGRVLAALDEVACNLTAIVGDIRVTAEEINTASSEIASGNADLSMRTETTASSLQRTAASVDQLTATIRDNADHAREAKQLASEASGVAREGGAMVAEVVSTMNAINSQAKKIADIIGTIDGIAFQTNILALNAAVEAARAGEQGRGFTVVAAEVRTLAQRSSESAREIRKLIMSSVAQIDSGAGRAQAAGETMGRIVGSIEQVAQTVSGISAATTEQATGIEQVNRSVAEMDRSTQQNAAMVEQASAATESLNSQARRLIELLARFKTATA